MYDEDEVFEYLLNLRDRGVVNMFQASPYLQEEFGMTTNESSQWLGDWIQSFSKPTCENCD